MEFYAHSLEGRPISEWHGLEGHLKGPEGTVPDLHLCGELPKGIQRHRALGDARLTAEVWMAMKQRMGK